MNALTEPENHLPSADHFERLAAVLRAGGFTVTVTPPALTVRNPDADAARTTASSGLAQKVLLREDAGRLVWCWVWPGLRPARRGDPIPPPEIELIGPAEEIAETARLIAKVIRIDESTGTPR
ncbi:hypothetical protein GCM10023196_001440 [Actinoallomurus vinaceus]|uniref:Uncharacterized protein n=1 Tax=Actinoallomurus vinaceus TaxID=1080074 RepID=A0ABP8U0P8_9ACTN